MARKIFKIVCGIACVFGFLLMLGTAGSNDLGMIGLAQTVWQLLLGLGLFAAGGYLGGFIQ